MATASIQIVQSGVVGAPGRSRDDLVLGQPVTLRNANDAGVTSWRWLLVSRPYGSAAALSNVVAAQPTFTPDVDGTYLVQLTVNEGRAGEVSRVLATVRNAAILGISTRFLAAAEDNEANWLTDFGAGPVINTTGWWDDMDRWLRLIYAVASGGGPPPTPTWEDTLTAGPSSGSNNAILGTDTGLWYESGPNGIDEFLNAYRSGRSFVDLTPGSDTWEQMGQDLAPPFGGGGGYRFALIRVQAVRYLDSGGGFSHFLLEQAWDSVGNATTIALSGTGFRIRRFPQGFNNRLALDVFHAVGNGVRAKAMVDVIYSYDT